MPLRWMSPCCAIPYTAWNSWLSAQVGQQLVGFVFPLQDYPRLDRFNSVDITSIEQLQREKPIYYVLNADYARA